MLKRLLQYTSGSSDIESHESFTARSEHGSVIESQMRAVYKEMIELSVIEVELPAIEPYQERSLRAQRTDERQVFAAVSFHKQYVFFHIAEHFPSPCFPVAESCYFLTFSLMSGISAPVSVLGIILPIYTIIDMIETAENVWSDSCVCAMVNKTQLS